MPKNKTDSAEQKRPKILEFEKVALNAPNRRHRSMFDVNFTARAGELSMVLDSTDRMRQPLGDGALGLIAPDKGRVLYDQKDWTEIPYQQLLRRRSTIGRVFAKTGWVDNLTVLDNVTLSQRHHSLASNDNIIQKANAVAAKIGINSIPDSRPVNVSPVDLRRLQWVRALLAEPKLLILEEPLDGIPKSDHALFFNVESKFRSHGGATLWVTDNHDIWSSTHDGTVHRFRINQEQLEPVEGATS